MSAVERAGVEPALLDVVEYRKSGLSLNSVIGCPLDCGYCVRHVFGNFGMKAPRAVMGPEEAVAALTGHRFFQPHVTPVQLMNRATDPMLPVVKPHVFEVLRRLDEQKLTNHVLLITRWRVGEEDCARLNALRHLKVTLLVTYSGIEDERIEPVDSGIAARSLEQAFTSAQRYRVILYWRPIVPGLNDSDRHLARALELSGSAHATVFTGLFFRDQIREYYRAHGLPEPYERSERRKIFPERLEQRILAAGPPGSPLFRKTSCAVAFAHGVADYNGHFGIRELCDICPAAQVARCADGWAAPDARRVEAMARELGGKLVAVTERAVVVEGLDEQRRYLMQHTLGFQIHDAAKPHHPHRHGRADLGWPVPVETS
ncbi:radical SAM protein [Actinosynnema sp. CA-248983]